MPTLLPHVLACVLCNVYDPLAGRLKSSVVDPDPNWIPSQPLYGSGSLNLYPDPNSYRKKDSTDGLHSNFPSHVNTVYLNSF